MHNRRSNGCSEEKREGVKGGWRERNKSTPDAATAAASAGEGAELTRDAYNVFSSCQCCAMREGGREERVERV